MYVSSSADEPRRLKRCVIKEELVELTGSFQVAATLQQMIYWQERARDFDAYFEQERARALTQGLDVPDLTTRGWWYKKAEELSEETMLRVSVATMRKYVQQLVDLKLVQERHNPKHGYDRTMQYRVDLVRVQAALLTLGYALEGYRFDTSALEHPQAVLEIKNGAAKTKNRSVEISTAIPEIKTEISTETKKSVVVQPSAAPTDEASQMLPTSERRSAAVFPGGYELKLSGNVTAQRAFRAASGDASALKTACLCIDTQPEVWTWLVKAYDKRIRDADVFHNLLADIADDLEHRTSAQVASDLKQSFEQAKGSFLGYYRKIRKIPRATQKAAQGFSRHSRRGGRSEAEQLEHTRNYRERARAESMAAFGGRA